MEHDFDPYYKWLGIPPRDQPPNHYRLLGIEWFESDRDVIDAAANRVMSYLKDLAVGDEADHSQKLWNEVARARLCLLNRQKKEAYDAELRAKTSVEPRPEHVASPAEPPGPPPAPPPTTSPGPPVPALNLSVPQPGARPARKPPRDPARRAGTKLPVLALAGVALILIILVSLGAMLLLGRSGQTPVARFQPGSSLPSWEPRKASGVKPAPNQANRDQPSPGPQTDPSSSPDVQQPPETSPPDETEPPSSPAEAPPSISPELPALPGWGDSEAPVMQPSDGPAGGGLPQRKDFFDSSPVPEVPDDSPDDATPPDDQPGPAQSSAVADGQSPFRALPPSVTLPEIGQPDASPTILGTILLPEGTRCSVQVRGGEKAIRGNQAFTLRNAEQGAADREWEILLRDGDSLTKLAHLALDSAGRLGFRWEAAAASAETAAHLANCALVLDLPGNPPHVIRLRQAVQSEPLVVDLERTTSPRSNLRIDSLPDPTSTFLEVVAVGGTDFEAKPGPVVSAAGGEALLTLEDSGNLLVLKVKCTVRHDGLSLEVSPQLLKAETAEPEPFLVKRFPQFVKEAKQFGQSLQWKMQQANQALRQNPTPVLRQNLQQSLVALQHQEREYQDYDLRLVQLQAYLDTWKNKLELHVRVYCDAEGTEIDLLIAGDSANRNADQDR
jgi:hypothetical protein